MDWTPVVTGAAIGMVVAAATSWLASRRDRERWEREDAIRRNEAEQARRERWIDHRRDVYASLMAQADIIGVVHGLRRTGSWSAERQGLDYYGAIRALIIARARVEIASPALRTVALELSSAALTLMTMTNDDDAYRAADTAFSTALVSFEEAAVLDLA